MRSDLINNVQLDGARSNGNQYDTGMMREKKNGEKNRKKNKNTIADLLVTTDLPNTSEYREPVVQDKKEDENSLVEETRDSIVQPIIQPAKLDLQCGVTVNKKPNEEDLESENESDNDLSLARQIASEENQISQRLFPGYSDNKLPSQGQIAGLTESEFEKFLLRI